MKVLTRDFHLDEDEYITITDNAFLALEEYGKYDINNLLEGNYTLIIEDDFKAQGDCYYEEKPIVTFINNDYFNYNEKFKVKTIPIGKMLNKVNKNSNIYFYIRSKIFLALNQISFSIPMGWEENAFYAKIYYLDIPDFSYKFELYLK